MKCPICGNQNAAPKPWLCGWEKLVCPSCGLFGFHKPLPPVPDASDLAEFMDAKLGVPFANIEREI